MKKGIHLIRLLYKDNGFNYFESDHIYEPYEPSDEEVDVFYKHNQTYINGQ